VSTGAKYKTKLPTGKKIPGHIFFEGKTTGLSLPLASPFTRFIHAWTHFVCGKLFFFCFGYSLTQSYFLGFHQQPRPNRSLVQKYQ